MADTYQTRAQLVTDFGDNTSGAITAQLLRDFLYSTVLTSSTGLVDVGAATSKLFKLPGDLDLNGKNILNGATVSLDSANITSDGSGNLTAVTFVGSLAGTQLNPIDLDGNKLLNVGIINSALTFAHVEWDGTHAYVANEVVYDPTGKLWYVCTASNTNHEPPNASYWAAIATGDQLIYYGSGIYGTDVGNPETNVIQVRAITPLTSFCLGAAVADSGTYPLAPPNDYLPGNNIAMGGAFLTDCNSCFSNLGTMTSCEESVSMGCDGVMSFSFQGIALGNIDHMIHVNNCIAAIGATVSGASDAARTAHSVAIGNACIVTASGAFALGAGITNSTASTFQVGYADATKVSINATGIGFYGHAAAAKPTITGIRASNTALASLLTALVGLGLIVDSTTAT